MPTSDELMERAKRRHDAEEYNGINLGSHELYQKALEQQEREREEYERKLYDGR